jgi:predicted RNase H-like HicB family nuclease
LKVHVKPKAMKFIVETEQEDDGRWIAEVIDLPGVLVYAQTCEEAITQVQALALRVLAERLERGETESNLVSISFQAA